MNHESEPLKQFHVLVNETCTVVYYVEARNAQEAEDTYWDDFPYERLKRTGDADQVISVEEA